MYVSKVGTLSGGHNPYGRKPPGKSLLIWVVSPHFDPNRMQLDCFVNLNEMAGGGGGGGGGEVHCH